MFIVCFHITDVPKSARKKSSPLVKTDHAGCDARLSICAIKCRNNPGKHKHFFADCQYEQSPLKNQWCSLLIQDPSLRRIYLTDTAHVFALNVENPLLQYHKEPQSRGGDLVI